MCRASDWTWEDVTPSTSSWSLPALAVDAAGDPHLMWGAAHTLDYAYRAPGGSWTTETVDQDPNFGPATQVSMAIDASGGVHAAYGFANSDPSSYVEQLKYAYRAPGGGWTTTVVDTAAYGDGYSLAVDSSGGVHIAYSMQTSVPGSSFVHYAEHSPGGSWSLSTIDQNGEYPAITIDAASGLHVAYERGSAIEYAHRPANGTAWSISAASPENAWTPSIAVDSAGGVHIVHEIASVTNVLEDAYLPPGASAWVRTLVTDLGILPSVVADSSGGVHLAGVMAGGFGYGYRPANGYWQIAGLKPGIQILSTALAIDKAGTLHALFMDQTATGYTAKERLTYGEGCAKVSCRSNGSSCTQPTDCCGTSCSSGTCECAGAGQSCSGNSDCCNQDCNAVGRCGCVFAGGICSTAADCCKGTCTNGVCACAAAGGTCSDGNDCCSGICNGGICGCSGAGCCNANGSACSQGSDCCSGTCSNSVTGTSTGSCCAILQGQCSANSDCCTGDLQCQSGHCCHTTGQTCTTTADCCSGACQSNHVCG